MQRFRGETSRRKGSDGFFRTFSSLLLLVGIVSLCLSSGLALASSHGEPEFLAIAYHDVVDNKEQLRADSVTLETLVHHFEWLVLNGYQPVSVDDLIAARDHTRALPSKPVLLCWDDSYKSFYTHVFPLLRAYKFPAVLAVVGSWKEADDNGKVQYGDELVSVDTFMSWQQIREVVQSGFVEVASHSMDLHSPRLADSYGDLLPAVITHEYYPDSNLYETDEELRKRVTGDLKANNDLIEKNSGQKVRVMVWPYGRYNQLAIDVAKSLGMTVTLTLDPVPASVDSLDVAGRKYPTLNLETRSFRESLKLRDDPGPKRFVRVDPKMLIDDDGKEERFGRFLERMKELKPGSVILEPVVENDRGLEALFTTSKYPVKQDRLTRLVWHTSRRAEVGVDLWLRSRLFTDEKPEQLFYEMGKQAPTGGVIVEYPTFSGQFLHYVSKHRAVHLVRGWNPQLTRKNRQNALSDNTLDDVSSTVFKGLEAYQYWQPFQEVSLTLSAQMLRSITSEQLLSLWGYFDYLYVTGVDEVVLQAGLLNKSVQEKFTSIDLRKIVVMMECTTEEKRFCAQMADNTKSLQEQGFISWGYQYDNFIDDLPELEMIRPFISLRSYPFIAR